MSMKFAIVLLAFVAYQGVFSSARQVSADGILDQIAEAIEKLKVALQAAIDKAVQALNNLLSKIVETANSLIEGIKSKINEIVAGAMEEINKLVEKAKELGVDVSDCVKDSDDEIEALAKNLVESAVKCVTDKVDEATGIVKEAINEIKDYINIITSLEEKVKGCGSGLEAIKCLGGILVEIIQATTSLPIEISEKVAKIVALVGGLEAAMAKCATDVGVNATVQVGNIVIDVGKCVADKIKENAIR